MLFRSSVADAGITVTGIGLTGLTSLSVSGPISGTTGTFTSTGSFSGLLTLGTGAIPTSPVPDTGIESPLAAKIMVGSNASPSGTNAPAVTLTTVTNGNVADGVGSGLSVYSVATGGVVDTGGTQSTDAINVHSVHAANGTAYGNLSGVYVRVVPRYSDQYATTATTSLTRAAGAITSLTKTGSGTGYTHKPNVYFFGGLPSTGTHATATATLNSNGTVNTITLGGGEIGRAHV